MVERAGSAFVVSPWIRVKESPADRAASGSTSGCTGSPLEVVFAIDEWFRENLGIPIQSSELDGGREWCLHRPAGASEPLLVRVTAEAMSLANPRLTSILEALAEDARQTSPDPPGYYLVTRDGISVRGMIRFGWDMHGQGIRCYVCSRLSAGSEGVRECREWRVSVDHADRGTIEGATLDDDRDTIQRLAIDQLRRTNGVRVPPPSWTWSILDADEREWWGRLDDAAAGTRIQLVEARSNSVKSLPWEPGPRPPRPAELRAIISRIRRG